ncbi:MAG: hypothetical protein HPY57_16155 [Ignavibacteria bacterium]|nr:hypothetical protein [Ignavibacteria bacterium]
MKKSNNRQPQLISSSIQKLKPKQCYNIYLTEHLTKSSAAEIKSYLDYAVNFQFKNHIDKQLNSIKYLYFGEKHIRFISQIVKLNKIDGCCAEYEGIKFFYIDILDDIYLSNASFIDINSMDIRYNEYIKEEFSDLFDVDVLYENVPDLMKKGVLTLNCYLGDVNIIKLKCDFGNSKAFYRKLKLSRIIKKRN